MQQNIIQISETTPIMHSTCCTKSVVDCCKPVLLFSHASRLKLKSISYSSAKLKGLADSENPLDPVNRIHCLLKLFLNAHSGFCREEIQDCLNLYSFVINAPSDHLEKVEKMINSVFDNPKSLKYNEQFGLKS